MPEKSLQLRAALHCQGWTQMVDSIKQKKSRDLFKKKPKILAGTVTVPVESESPWNPSNTE